MYIFLTVLGTWLAGMFFTEVVMKAGFRNRLNFLCDEDLSTPFIIFWPAAWLIFTVFRTTNNLYIFLDYLTSVIAKKIQRILKGERNASESTGPR